MKQQQVVEAPPAAAKPSMTRQNAIKEALQWQELTNAYKELTGSTLFMPDQLREALERLIPD